VTGSAEDCARLAKARRAAFFWALFMLVLTSWPSPPEIPVVSAIPDFDKLVHASLYGVFGFLLYFSIAWKGPAPTRASWGRALAVAVLVAAWGTLDEVHQIWIPGRSAEVADAATDTIAGLAGALVAAATAARRVRATAGAAGGPVSPRPSPRP
jgi:VanZ family protein